MLSSCARHFKVSSVLLKISAQLCVTPCLRLNNKSLLIIKFLELFTVAVGNLNTLHHLSSLLSLIFTLDGLIGCAG